MRVRMLSCLGLLAAGLAGCAEVPVSPLAKDAAAGLRLAQVEIKVADDATVLWGNAEHEYVVAQRAAPAARKAKPIETGSLGDPANSDAAEATALANSAEGKAFVRAKVVERLKGAVGEAFKGRLEAGTRAVKLEVVVTGFFVPSAIQRVVLGGAPGLTARVVLRDAVTGAELAARDNFGANAYAGNGIGGVLIDQALEDLDVRLARNFAVDYRRWLLNEAA